jgi:hypothetical protein
MPLHFPGRGLQAYLEAINAFGALFFCIGLPGKNGPHLGG